MLFEYKVLFYLVLSVFLSINYAECVNHYYQNTAYISTSTKQELLIKIKSMFDFGYENYMKHAFPFDELDPIHCTGRGHDHINKQNINVNDALGDYLLTLVDSLDTLLILGKKTEFEQAVRLISDRLSFDKNNTVQVFEATIRVLGGLLSGYLLLTDQQQLFGPLFTNGWERQHYASSLLSLASDLGSRLMPAFHEWSGTGLPYPRINLRHGLRYLAYEINETCVAGAGSLLLEFATLGRLLGDPSYEHAAVRAMHALWKYKSNTTGLVGNTIHIQQGVWMGRMSGVGAGLDSHYEYLLKGYILLGDPVLYQMFQHYHDSLFHYSRRGPLTCLHEFHVNVENSLDKWMPALLVNVDMLTGDMINTWIDSLQAAWPGVLVLAGEVNEAICLHAVHYVIWKKYGVLPERYNWAHKRPDVNFYPLRPELVESTYFLYRATKHPFYLQVGQHIFESIQNHTQCRCGYATVHDVHDMSLEDRMESFFLSETCKYLFLLFDEQNILHRHDEDFLFSTEGHLFPIKRLRKMAFDSLQSPHGSPQLPHERLKPVHNHSCLNDIIKSSKYPFHEAYWTKLMTFAFT